jgi:hypothetical protein
MGTIMQQIKVPIMATLKDPNVYNQATGKVNARLYLSGPLHVDDESQI